MDSEERNKLMLLLQTSPLLEETDRRQIINEKC